MRFSLLILFFFLFFSPLSGLADTATFGENSGDDHTGVTDDMYVYSGTPSNNCGACTTALAGTFFGSYNSVLRFEISIIPSGATIDSATLSVVSDVNNASATLSIHKMLSGNSAWWPEGTKNGAAGS